MGSTRPLRCSFGEQDPLICRSRTMQKAQACVAIFDTTDGSSFHSILSLGWRFSAPFGFSSFHSAGSL